MAKTTLIRLILEEITPDTGQLTFPAEGLDIAYQPQVLNRADLTSTLHAYVTDPLKPILQLKQDLESLEADMSEARGEKLQTIFEEYGRIRDAFEVGQGYALDHKINTILTGLNLHSFPPDTPLSQLSSGQRTRAALARILLTAADLIILDEPTNHLDLESIQWLEEHLRDSPKPMIVISHDRRLLRSVATKIWNLAYGRLEQFPGGYDAYQAFCRERLESDRHRYESQQKEIKRLEAAYQKRMGWSANKEKEKTGSGPVDRGFIGARSARLAKTRQIIASAH